MAYDTTQSRNSGRRTKAEQVVHDVRTRLDEAWDYERENRQEAATDLAFLAGDQWTDQDRRDREADRRPMLTINRLPQFLRQVTNDIRQADLGIKAAPVDDKSDPKLAKIYNGLIKQIQYQSNANHVFATAAEHQCACGIGWFRVLTDYVDDSAFDQEIQLASIPQPLSVYCDPAAIKPDRSDAMWMIVTEIVPTATFKERYPDVGEISVDRTSDGSMSRLYWATIDAVRIAEYWVKTPYKKTIGLTPDGETIDLTDIKPLDRAFLPPIVKTRTMTAYRIEQYLVTGADVLEGPNKWPGKHIPLIPVLGAEIPLDQKTYRHGLVRYARDPQKLYNFARSSAAEMLAAQPKAPYLVTLKMIGDGPIKQAWDTANLKHRPYLPYLPDPAMPGGPKREAPPQMPAAYFQESQIADGDMKATTGIYDASLGSRSNETSGRAIFARQHEGDVANYHYSDNLELSLQHCGRILIDLIPKIYDNERVVRIMGEDEAEEFIPINREAVGYDGMPMLINDLSAARFDVRVTIGPSYSTKRQETAQSLVEFGKMLNPEQQQAITDLIASALDFPKAEQVAKRLRNMIPPAVLADPDDPNNPPPPPPNPLEDPVLRSEIVLRDAQAAKAYADADKVRREAMGMIMPPEPMLPRPEDILMTPGSPSWQESPQHQPQDAIPQGPQPSGGTEQPGNPQEFDPAQLQALLGGLPPAAPPPTGPA